MAHASPEASARPVIEVNGLVTHYGEREILHGIDLSVRQGEIMVIMGGSGSGKTTLLRHLLGLERATSGSIRILGHELTEMTDLELYELSRKLGVECELGPRLGSVKHAITFRRLTVEAFRIEPAVPLRLRGRKGFRWARLEELGKSVPVPSLALKLARRIIESAAPAP